MTYKVLANFNAKKEFKVGDIVELDDLVGFEALYLSNGTLKPIEAESEEVEASTEAETEVKKSTKSK